ncbi:erythromycin biosynthesis sensory transduction protein eryC1, partial [Nitrospirales bacterium NOB]|nr:erythromycin biosynthesis sensory transduction protein eryC1 [Nitrospirales bacterium NOB]
PGKNLGACGEAGAVTTNNAELAQKMRMIRDHGQAKKYYHDVEGYNGRLDAIQAGILSVKLKHLRDWTEKRQAAALRYRELFGPNPDGIILPHEPEWSRAVYHLYVVRTGDRENFQKHLGEAQIGTGIHYPIPLHLQRAYSEMNRGEGSLPVVEKIAKEIVSLPMFPGITAEQQSRVVERVREFVSCPKV